MLSDRTGPDRSDDPRPLPNPTQNATYDPYYVRVVFVQRLKAYNMSIIVPSIAYDQYGHLAQTGYEAAYTNLVAKTDDFSLGYMSSLHDASRPLRSARLPVLSRGRAEPRSARPANLCLHQPALSLGCRPRAVRHRRLPAAHLRLPPPELERRLHA